MKTRSPTTSQLLRKTQQKIKDHSTHLFHDLVATSEVEALLQQASPHYQGTGSRPGSIFTSTKTDDQNEAC